MHENLEDYNPTKNKRVLIVFDHMIVKRESNKTLSPIFTELLLRGKELNISLVFIFLLYLKVPKTVRLNAAHYFIMKTPNKRQLQQSVKSFVWHWFYNFMKLYKNYTKEP